MREIFKMNGFAKISCRAIVSQLSDEDKHKDTLHGNTLKVYIFLVKCSKWNYCTVSAKELARQLHLNQFTVPRLIAKLERLGFVKTTYRHKTNGHFDWNQYQILKNNPQNDFILVPTKGFGELSGKETEVLCAQCYFARCNAFAFPSRRQVHELTGMSETTFCKCMKSLKKKGIIDFEHYRTSCKDYGHNRCIILERARKVFGEKTGNVIELIKANGEMLSDWWSVVRSALCGYKKIIAELIDLADDYAEIVAEKAALCPAVEIDSFPAEFMPATTVNYPLSSPAVEEAPCSDNEPAEQKDGFLKRIFGKACEEIRSVVRKFGSLFAPSALGGTKK